MPSVAETGWHRPTPPPCVRTALRKQKRGRMRTLSSVMTGRGCAVAGGGRGLFAKAVEGLVELVCPPNISLWAELLFLFLSQASLLLVHSRFSSSLFAQIFLCFPSVRTLLRSAQSPSLNALFPERVLNVAVVLGEQQCPSRGCLWGSGCDFRAVSEGLHCFRGHFLKDLCSIHVHFPSRGKKGWS